MQILEQIKIYDELENQFSDLKQKAILDIKTQFSIKSLSEVKKLIAKLKEENRLLKIGIVGRVKAGKSSLLNALVFNGESVLPKAATPMTAALTEIEYGENLSAKINFYLKEDLEKIKNEHANYLAELKRISDEEFERRKERRERKEGGELSSETLEEIRQNAIKSAKNELSNNLVLFSAYDQFERMKANPLEICEENCLIEAENIAELNEKLEDYVGANGKFMPYTKSVTLSFNQENLKDVQIIDTPGVNDPIVSREDRTRELLGECDVVFVVSPAGQFINDDDSNLIDRLGNQESVSEIYVIASKVDEQLFGSEYEKSGKNLDLTIKNLSEIYTTQLDNFCKMQLKNTSYAKELWQRLNSNQVIVSSGIAYSLLLKTSGLDEIEEHTLKNLKEYYPKEFSHDAAKSSLEKLANINLVKEKLECVKSKKDELIAQKEQESLKQLSVNFNEFIACLKTTLQEQIDGLKELDLDKLKTQSEQLLAAKEKANKALNTNYKNECNKIDSLIKSNLKNIVKINFSKEDESVDDNVTLSTREESYTEYRTVSRTVSDSTWYKPWTWFSTRTVYEEVPVTRYRTITDTNVMAGTIYSGLVSLTKNLENLVSFEASTYISAWKKELSRAILQALRDNLEARYLNDIAIANAINLVINSINLPQISYTNRLPSELNKSGKLMNEEGKKYVEDIKIYLQNLERNVLNDIDTFMANIIKCLEKIDLASRVFASYDEQINEQKKQIIDKENTIKTKQNLLEKLQILGEDNAK